MNTERKPEVVALKPAVPRADKKPAREIKPKLEIVTPAHIVEVWKLFEKSVRDYPWPYPSLDEEAPEALQHHLFRYITEPMFFGMQIRVGRKAVGQIIGQVQTRPFGRPRAYAFILNFYVEPEFRKKGYMKLLSDAYFAHLKSKGIHYWEANVHDPALVEFLRGYTKRQTLVRFERLGGKV